MPFSLPSHFQDAFAAIIRALCGGLAGRYARPNNFPQPLFVALHTFLSSRIRRFASLVARVRAGTIRIRPPRPRLLRSGSARPPRPPAYYLSHRRGWLLPVIPGAIAYASQLNHLLAQPDMAELIARAPTLGRLLRPLAHMLAMDLPAALQRPAPVRAARPKPEKPKPTPPDYTAPSRRPSIVVRGTRLPRRVFGPG